MVTARGEGFAALAIDRRSSSLLVGGDCKLRVVETSLDQRSGHGPAPRLTRQRLQERDAIEDEDLQGRDSSDGRSARHIA